MARPPPVDSNEEDTPPAEDSALVLVGTKFYGSAATACTEPCMVPLYPEGLQVANTRKLPSDVSNAAIPVRGSFRLQFGSDDQYLTTGLSAPTIGLAPRKANLEIGASTQLFELRAHEGRWQLYSQHWKQCAVVNSEGVCHQPGELYERRC